MLSCDYPGNVRELRNIIERAVILAGGAALAPYHFKFESNDEIVKRTIPLTSSVERRNRRLDAARIREALAQADGHRARAAGILGVSERTLYRHLVKLQLPDLPAEPDTDCH